ncbi:NUDIX hydrolase [Streptomyces yunnanensis]|uniref:NUDIX hydrolase n=1 Tax=Streptomyces yunnanensis TaxID=156453 RepID=A0ABY8AFV6_9ACTN|nr:NUDIX hydrolase [Streptomyces yunnanensis]WEB42810.1 NUDIX hydrolase [Streptomyces yunnanensis]
MLELDETAEDGVCREVYEETGITVRVDRLTGVYKNMSRGVVAMVFRCHAESGHERLSDESAAVEWLTREEISELMGDVYAIRVLDAFRNDDPQVRSHDGQRLIA